MQTKNQSESREEIRRLVSCPPARVVVAGPSKTGKHVFIRSELLVLTAEQDMLEVDGTIDGARQAQRFVKTTPVVGTIRAVLIDGRGGFTDPAQDACLKICEETPESSAVVIVVEDEGALRPALLSRLDLVRWHSISDVEMRHDTQLDDFVLLVARGRPGLCGALSSRLEEMKSLYSAACDVVAGKPDLSSVPRLILEWSKLDDDTKDAVLAVCVTAIRSGFGIRASMMSQFVQIVTSVPSANAEIYWWRSCVT